MTEHDAQEVNETESMDGTREKAKNEGKRIIEEIEVAGRDAVSRAQELIEQGNVRRLIFLRDDDRVILEVPLTAGVVAGTAAVLMAPTLSAIGALAGFLAKIKIRVVRSEDEE
ncbi:MAG: DUF4342 domain-containing protein [Chloroflexota bacterium]